MQQQLQYLIESVFTNPLGPGFIKAQLFRHPTAFVCAASAVASPKWPVCAITQHKASEMIHFLANGNVISPSGQWFIPCHNERTVSASLSMFNTRIVFAPAIRAFGLFYRPAISYYPLERILERIMYFASNNSKKNK